MAANETMPSPARPARWRRRATWGAIGLIGIAVAGWLALHLVPLPAALFAGPVAEVELLDRNGEPLRVVRPDDAPFAHPVAYREIPRPLIEATLAAEDQRFWSHPGVDVLATFRAFGQFVRHGRVVSGGSTITQQLIKLAEPRPRTLRTKMIEAVQAIRLEQVWDKQRILAEYLNRLDYGNFNRGAVAAARFYFAKPLADLSPAECALLAAIPQAPSRLNPVTHMDRARKRQQWILARMQAAGWLAREELQRDLCEPLVLAKPRRVFAAPHFVDLLLAAGELNSPSAGRPNSFRTSLDLALNRFAEQTLRAHLAGLQAQHVSNGAVVIIDNRTGEVLGLVGSENYFAPAAGEVNHALAPRSPGSALKPFTYLLALEHGATPASIVADVPTEFATATGLFAPVNYNRHCYGPMRYRPALANSLNISAVKVLASLGGPAPLENLLQECGLTTLDHPPEDYGLGLTLGNAEVRLLELANAYASLARLGEYRPYQLRAVADGFSPSGRRVADPTAAYLIADILSDNDARTPAFGAESSLRFDFPVACKTGTSSDFRDNWAFGYTPEFTVGVWVGNPDSSPMRDVSGVTGAAPILHELFEHLHQRDGTTWYPQPINVIAAWVDPLTGKRLKTAGVAATPGAIEEKFSTANLPPFAGPADYETSLPARRVRLGLEYRDWFATGDNWLGDRAVLAGGSGSPRITFPPPGTTVYLDADLPGQGRKLTLSATGPARLEWRSDTLQLVSEGNREVAMLTEGRHQITVRDPASGAVASTWVDVLSR